MIRLSAPLRPLAALAGRVFARWVRTWRVEVLRADGTLVALRDYAIAPAVYALCERDLVAITAAASATPAVALVAPGDDGDWVVAIARPLGCRFARGSSRRDGMTGSRQLIEMLRSDPALSALVAVDGPLGPSGVVREGVVHCAAWSARPLVPVVAAARRAIVFRRSWAQHYLPLPFTRIVLAAGAPLVIEQPLDRDAGKAGAEKIAQQFELLRARAEHAVAAPSAVARASVRRTT